MSEIQKSKKIKIALDKIFSFTPSETVYMRSCKDTQESRLIALLKKEFNDIKTEIEIHKQGRHTAQIRITLLKSIYLHSQPVRVTLLEKDREIASYPLSVPVVIKDIPFGNYVLIFSRGRIQEGEFRFKIEDSLND